MNALHFRELIEGARVAAPPPLVDACGDELKGCPRAAESGLAAA